MMNSSQKASASLESFPPELWASITQYLVGEQLGRLKLTGSKQLWLQLSAPRAVTAAILGDELIQFKKWPAFVNQLPSLQEIDIRIEDNVENDFWQPRLAMIPKNIQKLRISGSTLCINTFFSHEGGTFASLIEHTPLLNSLSVSTIWSRVYAWQAHIPPNLTFLKVSGLHADSMLPSTLLHLEIDYIFDRIPLNVLKLPPCLETIVMKQIDAHVCSAPSLLSISSGVAVGLTPQNIRAISRKATVLHGISLDKKPSEDFGLYASPIEIFPCPPCLTELTATSLPIECWPFLPRTLKYLKLSRVSFPMKFADNDPSSTQEVLLPIVPTQNLPKSITHLHLEFDEPFFFHASACPSPSNTAAFHSTDAYSLFPPRTTILRLHSAQLSAEATKQLPTSLFELSLRNLDESVIDYLPKSLTVLKSYAQEPSPSFIHRLPKSLTELHLWKPAVTQSWFDPDTGVKRRVAHFTTNHSSKPTFENCSPPTYLKKLELENNAEFGEEFFCRYGRHLEELSLQFLFSDASIPHLSRHLIELILLHNTELTGKCFGDLPRLLTRLEMTSVKNISDSDIKHLPRQLQHLKLSSAIHLTNASLKDFPRFLLSLDLSRNEHITEEGLTDLPPKFHGRHGSRAVFESAFNSELAALATR